MSSHNSSRGSKHRLDKCQTILAEEMHDERVRLAVPTPDKLGARKRLSGRKILILIGGHLATGPRAQKEARALRAAGAEVMVRGASWSPALGREDMTLAQELDVDFAPVVDLSARGNSGIRLRQRLARECFTYLGLVTPRVFGTGAPELLREARRINAELTMVHSEAGLWVGKHLLADGRRVGVDFEDWFSQNLPQADRRERPVAALQMLERHMLRSAQCCLTTTHALADALAQDAGTDRVPVVVPNCFPAAERAQASQGVRDVTIRGAVSFHWFSQTIGAWRGLETLARALPRLRGKWQVSLRGSLHGRRDWFNRTFPEQVRPRVQLLEPVSNADLLARTMSHDVGLALEEPYCPSHDLTASNKLFEYIRAGIAVIATRTRGQEEVMRASPGVGVLISPQDHLALADAMQRMIDDPAHLEMCQRAAVEAAQGTWAWERHVDTLVNAVSSALVSVEI